MSERGRWSRRTLVVLGLIALLLIDFAIYLSIRGRHPEPRPTARPEATASPFADEESPAPVARPPAPTWEFMPPPVDLSDLETALRNDEVCRVKSILFEGAGEGVPPARASELFFQNVNRVTGDANAAEQRLAALARALFLRPVSDMPPAIEATPSELGEQFRALLLAGLVPELQPLNGAPDRLVDPAEALAAIRATRASHPENGANWLFEAAIRNQSGVPLADLRATYLSAFAAPRFESYFPATLLDLLQRSLASSSYFVLADFLAMKVPAPLYAAGFQPLIRRLGSDPDDPELERAALAWGKRLASATSPLSGIWPGGRSPAPEQAMGRAVALAAWARLHPGEAPPEELAQEPKRGPYLADVVGKLKESQTRCEREELDDRLRALAAVLVSRGRR